MFKKITFISYTKAINYCRFPFKIPIIKVVKDIFMTIRLANLFKYIANMLIRKEIHLKTHYIKVASKMFGSEKKASFMMEKVLAVHITNKRLYREYVSYISTRKKIIE